MRSEQTHTVLRCYYCPRTRTIIDATLVKDHALALFGIDTEEEVLALYPEARLMTYGDAFAACEESVSSAAEIDRWTYTQELDRVAPEGWTILGHTESFRTSRCGRVTPIFCRVGERYFQLLERGALTHEEIVQRVVTSHYLRGERFRVVETPRVEGISSAVGEDRSDH